MRRRTPFGAALDASLAYLRDHRLALVAILALANLLSLLDLGLTTMALRLGAAEANPIMGYFFEASATHAAAVKCCLAAAVTFGLWGLRRYRRALMTALFFFAAFGAVVLYEIVGLAQLT